MLKELDKYKYRFNKGNLLSDYYKGEFVGDNSHIIKSDELAYLGCGMNSSVWSCSLDGKEYALKIPFDNCRNCFLTKDTYERMKELPLQRIANPLETYRLLDSLDEDFDAYLMERLFEGEDEELLDLPIPDLILNSRLIEEDGELLADNKIAMADVGNENSLFCQKRRQLYMTDIDLFFPDDDNTVQECRDRNREGTFYVFSDYFADCIERIYFLESEYLENLHNLEAHLWEAFDDNIALSDCLEDLFAGYETPREYFKAKK